MNQLAHRREYESLKQALGPAVASALSDPMVTDVMLNADGRLIIDRRGEGQKFTGHTISPEAAEHALRQLANYCGVPITRDAPILQANMPITGERVAGAISPAVDRPIFAIRRPPAKVFGFEDFVDDDESRRNLDRMLEAIEAGKTLLIAGSTGSGKTSLLSAILTLPIVTKDRVLALEDTTELVLDSIPNHVRLLTSATVDMRELVRLSLRMRPDRIIVGELRQGSAALEWIGACNTGHGGSFATIHSSGAAETLGRVEDLLAQVCVQTPARAIRHAIECVVFVTRTAGGKRRIAEVLIESIG